MTYMEMKSIKYVEKQDILHRYGGGCQSTWSSAKTYHKPLQRFTLDNTISNTNLIADTGESNHITGKKHILGNIDNYYDYDSIVIGDGSYLSNNGIDNTCIN